MPQNRNSEAFSAPPGYDELFGLDLSHLSPEERVAILQVAARAKHVEQVETRKVRNIKNQVDAYAQHKSAGRSTDGPHNFGKTSNEVNKNQKPSTHQPSGERRVSKSAKPVNDGRNSGTNSRADNTNTPMKGSMKPAVELSDNAITGTQKPKTTPRKTLDCELCAASDKSSPNARAATTRCASCSRRICSGCSITSSVLAKKGETLCRMCIKQRELAARSNQWMKKHPVRRNINRSVSVDIPVQITEDDSTQSRESRRKKSLRRRSFSGGLSSLLQNTSLDIVLKPEKPTRSQEPSPRKSRNSDITVSDMLLRSLSTDKSVQNELRKQQSVEEDRKQTKLATHTSQHDTKACTKPAATVEVKSIINTTQPTGGDKPKSEKTPQVIPDKISSQRKTPKEQTVAKTPKEQTVADQSNKSGGARIKSLTKDPSETSTIIKNPNHTITTDITSNKDKSDDTIPQTTRGHNKADTVKPTTATTLQSPLQIYKDVQNELKDKFAKKNSQTKSSSNNQPNMEKNHHTESPLHSRSGWESLDQVSKPEEGAVYHGTSSVASSIADSDGPAEWSVGELDDCDTLFLVTSSNADVATDAETSSTHARSALPNSHHYDVMENDTEGDFEHLVEHVDDVYSLGGLKRVAPFTDLWSVATSPNQPTSAGESFVIDDVIQQNYTDNTKQEVVASSNLPSAMTPPSSNVIDSSKKAHTSSTTKQIFTKLDHKSKDNKDHQKTHKAPTTENNTTPNKLNSTTAPLLEEEVTSLSKTKTSEILHQNTQIKEQSSIPQITISNLTETKQTFKPVRKSVSDHKLKSPLKEPRKLDSSSTSVKNLAMQMEQTIHKSKSPYINKFTPKNLHTTSTNRLPVSPLVTSSSSSNVAERVESDGGKEKKNQTSTKVYALHGSKYFESDSDDSSGSGTEEDERLILESATSSVPVYPEDMLDSSSTTYPDNSERKSLFFRRTTSTDNFEELLMKNAETPRRQRNKTGNSSKTKSASSLLTTPDTNFKSATWVRSISLSPPSHKPQDDEDGSMNSIRRNSEPSFSSTPPEPDDVRANTTFSNKCDSVHQVGTPARNVKIPLSSVPTQEPSASNAFCGMSFGSLNGQISQCTSCGTMANPARVDNTSTNHPERNEQKSRVVHSVTSSTQVSPERETAPVFPSIDLCQLTALIEALKGAGNLVPSKSVASEPVDKTENTTQRTNSTKYEKTKHSWQSHPVTHEPRSNVYDHHPRHKDKSTSTSITGELQIHPEDTILFPRHYIPHNRDSNITRALIGHVNASVGTDESPNDEFALDDEHRANVVDLTGRSSRYPPPRRYSHVGYGTDSRRYIQRPHGRGTLYPRHDYTPTYDYHCMDSYDPMDHPWQSSHSQYCSPHHNQYNRHHPPTYGRPCGYYDASDDAVIYEEEPVDGYNQFGCTSYKQLRPRDQVMVAPHSRPPRKVAYNVNRPGDQYSNKGPYDIMDPNVIPRSASVPAVSKPFPSPHLVGNLDSSQQMTNPSYTSRPSNRGQYPKQQTAYQEQEFSNENCNYPPLSHDARDAYSSNDKRYDAQANTPAASSLYSKPVYPTYSASQHTTSRGIPLNTARKDELQEDVKFRNPPSRSTSVSSKLGEDPSRDLDRSRRHLPDPPEDDEYKWRYNSVKRHSTLSSHSRIPDRRGDDGMVSGTHRLKQTIEDLDQQEKELDMKLRYLELGRQSKSNSSMAISSLLSTEQSTRHAPTIGSDKTPHDLGRDNTTVDTQNVYESNPARNYVVVDDVMQIITDDNLHRHTSPVITQHNSFQSSRSHHHLVANTYSRDRNTDTKPTVVNQRTSQTTNRHRASSEFNDLFSSPPNTHRHHARDQTQGMRSDGRSPSRAPNYHTNHHQQPRGTRGNQRDNNDHVHHVGYAFEDNSRHQTRIHGKQLGLSSIHDARDHCNVVSSGSYYADKYDRQNHEEYRHTDEMLDYSRPNNYIKTTPSRTARDSYQELAESNDGNSQCSRSTLYQDEPSWRNEGATHCEVDDMRTVVSDTEAYYLEREDNDWFHKPDHEDDASNYADFSYDFDTGKE